MFIIQVLILAIVQGVAELLPVSSSAHVIAAEKLMGLDPSSPQMTLLLVLLHTGTMFAVIVYFWQAWRTAFFSSFDALKQTIIYLVVATAITGVIGLALQELIKHFYAADPSKFQIEDLFSNYRLIAVGLAAAGILIIGSSRIPDLRGELTLLRAGLIGAVQGFCLPFRGFSRSGATISAGLLGGVSRARAEEFSFALAVVLTPAIVGKEVLRLLHGGGGAATDAATHGAGLGDMILPGLLGLVFSFASGLVALRWLSSWLGSGKWHYFGFYCLAASVFMFLLGG